ncbi:transposase family protein [Vibrio parahaemolyticus]|nr:transposase family protein [Vibrio parahaemolyticus]
MFFTILLPSHPCDLIKYSFHSPTIVYFAFFDIEDFLEDFIDPREENKIIYPFSSLIFMSFCAVASGADTWTDIVTWVDTNEDWITQHVDMTKGIPSYSTLL